MKAPKPEAAGDYLTIQEAADALKMKPGMVYRLCASKRLPHYRFGPKTLRIARSDLVDYARAHRET